MKRIIRLTESDLTRIVKRVIREEETTKEEKTEEAKELLNDILKPSEIEFLKQKFEEEGKEGFKDEVVVAIEDVKSAEDGELSEEDTEDMSDDEYKLRSIIHKIMERGTGLAALGILPAAMMGAPAVAGGLGIAALVGMISKDAAFWKRGGSDKYQTGHHYGAQRKHERESMEESYRRKQYRKRH